MLENTMENRVTNGAQIVLTEAALAKNFQMICSDHIVLAHTHMLVCDIGQYVDLCLSAIIPLSLFFVSYNYLLYTKKWESKVLLHNFKGMMFFEIVINDENGKYIVKK